MTRLSGEFETSLDLPDALVACRDAVVHLGWAIEFVASDRIVCHPKRADPPKIEVALSESDEGTDVRITGSDSQSNPMSREALTGLLDGVRDSIREKIEAAEAEPDQGEGDASSEWAGEWPDPAQEPDYSAEDLEYLARAYGRPRRRHRILRFVMGVCALITAAGIFTLVLGTANEIFGWSVWKPNQYPSVFNTRTTQSGAQVQTPTDYWTFMWQFGVATIGASILGSILFAYLGPGDD